MYNKLKRDKLPFKSEEENTLVVFNHSRSPFEVLGRISKEKKEAKDLISRCKWGIVPSVMGFSARCLDNQGGTLGSYHLLKTNKNSILNGLIVRFY